MTDRASLTVAFDGTPLLGQPTGVGFWTSELLSRLACFDELSVKTFAITWRGRNVLPSRTPAGVGCVRAPMPARPLREIWKRSNLAPIEYWTGRVNVVHGTNFIVPPSQHARGISTIHDVTAWRFPEFVTLSTLAYPKLVDRAVKHGAWLHANSEFVADEVRALFKIDPEKVVVLRPGIPALASGDSDRGHRILGSGSREYILSLGTNEPRKDLPLLVRAFNEVAADLEDVRLVLAGAKGWGEDKLSDEIAASKFRDRIVRLGYVSDRDRADLLNGASVFAYPSVYEGFGFPPLEAMQAGIPVVATRAGAIPEVVGDGAELVDVGDVNGFAEALAKIFSDVTACESLIERGRKRAQEFSWDEFASGMVGLYRRVSAQ